MRFAKQRDLSNTYAGLELPASPSFQAMTAATLYDLAAGRKCRVLEVGSGLHAPVSSTLASHDNFLLVCCDRLQPDNGFDLAKYVSLDLAQPLPFKDNSFDFVACTEVIEHLKNPFFVIEEIARGLRPEGYFLFSNHN